SYNQITTLMVPACRGSGWALFPGVAMPRIREETRRSEPIFMVRTVVGSCHSFLGFGSPGT
ncbi:hypothetical protein Dimus_034120, partial [Dionaea muscipula]